MTDAPDTEVDDRERVLIQQLLEGGLETRVEPRAYESEVIQRVCDELRVAETVGSKLEIAGFTLDPYDSGDEDFGEQACETCMYYEVHRKFCNLPELMLPVEAEWSCILWRI
ncbi:MAG: hypothetical protein RJS97_08630 [Parvibaculaceae bacterium]